MPTPSTWNTNGGTTRDGNKPGLSATGEVDKLSFTLNVVAKAAAYTLKGNESGTKFTTLGGTGAITFTLPALASCPAGYVVTFQNEVDQDMTVAAPTGKLVTFNNAAATSVAFSTAGNKIGASVQITLNSDGTKFMAQPMGAGTMTVA